MYLESSNEDWRPTATLSALRERSVFLNKVRQFFAEREVLEVDTPLLCARAVTDPYIQAFASDGKFLQTSPEYAMKRMLAAGYGSMYQICKAFRQEEIGRLHNLEFTMLEWYRVGFDHHQLMDEMDALIQILLDVKPARRFSYQEIFMEMVGINPHTVDIPTLQACALKHGIDLTPAAMQGLNVTDWLQILMSHIIEPKLIGPTAWMIYDFPLAQAALAKLVPGDNPVAARFEVYMQGVELANGYHELQNPSEQAKRFAADNLRRQQQKLHTMEPDQRLLSALEAGLPECAGVAMGLDRLLMIKLQANSLAEVMSFTSANA